mgnify:CR=1 FL=1
MLGCSYWVQWLWMLGSWVKLGAASFVEPDQNDTIFADASADT